MEGASSSDYKYTEKGHLPKNSFAFDRSVAFIVFLSGVSEVEKKMLNIKKLTLPFHFLSRFHRQKVKVTIQVALLSSVRVSAVILFLPVFAQDPDKKGKSFFMFRY